MLTFREALQETTARLQDAGSTSAGLDATLLLERAAGRDRIHLYSYPTHRLTEDQYTRFEKLVRRREKGEPMAYILGEREFWGLSFKVTPAVLIPRPDTETLVEAMLARAAETQPPIQHLVDLGTGSGAILLSLLHEWPQATGLGVDLSEAALEVAQENAAQLGLAERARFVQGDWASGLTGPVDMLVSNPPYIETADIDTLARDVRSYEPRTALDGGPDGLDCYRIIVAQAAGLVRAGGVLGLEVGHQQATALTTMLEEANQWTDIQIHNDLAGIGRAVSARRQ